MGIEAPVGFVVRGGHTGSTGIAALTIRNLGLPRLSSELGSALQMPLLRKELRATRTTAAPSTFFLPSGLIMLLTQPDDSVCFDLLSTKNNLALSSKFHQGIINLITDQNLCLIST